MSKPQKTQKQLQVKISSVDKLTTKNNQLPLVVLHGWAMNSKVWQVVRETLESQFLVYWIDLPGHGVNYDKCADSLDDICDLISAVLPQRCHLLGWSLGGIIAQSLAIKLGVERVTTVTLVASTPRFSQTADWLQAISSEILDQFSHNLMENLSTTIKQFIALQFLGVKDSEIDKADSMLSIRAIQKQLTQDILTMLPQQQALITGLEILKTADLRNLRKSANSTIPYHWILGGRDKLVPVKIAEALKLLNADDQITIIKQAGHAPFITHPDVFNKAVLDFIFSISH